MDNEKDKLEVLLELYFLYKIAGIFVRVINESKSRGDAAELEKTESVQNLCRPLGGGNFFSCDNAQKVYFQKRTFCA